MLQTQYQLFLSASGKADVYLDEDIIDVVLKDSYDTIIWSIENFKTSNTFDNTGTGLAYLQIIKMR
jgi:hypothetical protein